MSRTQNSVVTFPRTSSEPKPNSADDDQDSRGSYLQYLLALADTLLNRRVDGDGAEAA